MSETEQSGTNIRDTMRIYGIFTKDKQPENIQIEGCILDWYAEGNRIIMEVHGYFRNKFKDILDAVKNRGIAIGYFVINPIVDVVPLHRHDSNMDHVPEIYFILNNIRFSMDAAA